MKANELMIGDWVLDGNVYAQVTSITCDGNVETTHNEHSNIELIEPIPLTPDILEKNGFIRDMFYGEWQFDLDTFPFNFPFSVVQRKNNSWYLGREEIGIAHNREIIDISYVHELQHALRLCGVDKTIEL